ncbi:kinesin-like protein KIF16B isoform X2 [Dendronephthya gigantea]|uniref:kinesin-like protein KIF16B isoform X2 n=2 Tax=Dendronephthya gigantea TaxID=151771 RepID=UPI00106B3999|nr:kinesin-like protein KIF16B isoform X2 [Dendronephthya gigantea]
MASVKVAVRVRPLNQREDNKGASLIIEMEGKKTKISNFRASSVEKVKEFTFDHSYWSADRRSRNYSNQEKVFNDLGTMILKAAFEGYNACIFAYGQTGSGKTYTMMGDSETDPGLIPRICQAMFSRMKANKDQGVSYRTEVSYLEIYKEHVRDLLRPPAKGMQQHNLKVREHPRDGIYVQDLTKHLVSDFESIHNLMVEGSNVRVTASTNMNDTSSRSHAIFTISFTQAKFDHDMPSETVSKINLVDLAGSERADATGATGDRLKEGGLINKSLVTLGTVISHLADVSMHPQKKIFIPYRDSVLTWLLKDSLGGNSKTVMIATISPADINYAETLSTLRYANRAKNIINKPTVNEDANVKLIRELKAEIDRLKAMVNPEALGTAELAAAKKLSENEARVSELTDKWKDRWRETQKILEEREMALQREGVGIKMDSGLPHLVVVDDDLFSTGIVVYHLTEGRTTVGREDASQKQDIVISGPDTDKEHCFIENTSGNVVLNPLSSLCTINGNKIEKPAKLYQGDVVVLGKTNLFRFNHPQEAAELREKRKSMNKNGVNRVNMVSKFRSESDLLRGFITGSEREEKLSRELDQARNLLDKQKQEESLLLEKAKDELAAQIQEESKRLEETRHELEQQRAIVSTQTERADKTRVEYEKLEEKHRISETDRRKQELIYKHELECRMMKIESQKDELESLKEQFTTTERVREREIEEVKERIFEEKRAKIEELDNEVKRLLLLQSESKITRDAREEEMMNLQMIWKKETGKLDDEKEILGSLENDLCLLDKDVEEGKTKSGDYEQLEEERVKLVRKILKSKERISYLQQERQNAVSQLQKHLQNEREVLDWEVIECQKELRERRQMLEEQLNELEAEKDIAEDKLAEAEMELSNKVADQDRIIHVAQEQLFKLEEEVLQAIRVDDEELKAKRAKFDEENKVRTLAIAEKRREVVELGEKVERLRSVEETGNENEAKELEARLGEQKTVLQEMEEQSIIEEKKTEELLAIASRDLKQKQAKNEVDLEEERSKIEELKNDKQNTIKEYAKKVSHFKAMLEDAQSKLQEDKGKLKDLGLEEEALHQKLEAGVISIARKLKGVETPPEVENLISDLEVVNISGRAEITEKEESMSLELQKITNSCKVLEDSVMADENEKEKIENDLKEMREVFQKDRTGEKLELMQFVENVEGERSITVKKSDTDSAMFLEIQRARKEHEEVVLKLELEKQQLLLENERLERERYKEKQLVEQERLALEREKMDEIQTVIREKESELSLMKEEAQEKIVELKKQLETSDREIAQLQHKVTHYTSMINLPIHSEFDDEDDEEDPEIAGYLSRDNKRRRGGSVASLDGSVTPPSITPPPTPVSKFLASVIHNKRNAIHVEIPRFRIRGIGRVSYHVFEVRVTVGDETWTVFRRYKKFREMHNDIKHRHPEIRNISFPPRRFFGNRNESFVMVRKDMLESYLREMLNVCSTLRSCHLNVPEGQTLTKWDLSFFHNFFKQGIFEQTRAYNAS